MTKGTRGWSLSETEWQNACHRIWIKVTYQGSKEFLALKEFARVPCLKMGGVLADFSFTIKYRPGHSNKDADAL